MPGQTSTATTGSVALPTSPTFVDDWKPPTGADGKGKRGKLSAAARRTRDEHNAKRTEQAKALLDANAQLHDEVARRDLRIEELLALVEQRNQELETALQRAQTETDRANRAEAQLDRVPQVLEVAIELAGGTHRGSGGVSRDDNRVIRAVLAGSPPDEWIQFDTSDGEQLVVTISTKEGVTELRPLTSAGGLGRKQLASALASLGGAPAAPDPMREFARVVVALQQGELVLGYGCSDASCWLHGKNGLSKLVDVDPLWGMGGSEKSGLYGMRRAAQQGRLSMGATVTPRGTTGGYGFPEEGAIMQP